MTRMMTEQITRLPLLRIAATLAVMLTVLALGRDDTEKYRQP